MEMNAAERKLHDAACSFARSNRKRIAKEFTDRAVYLPEDEPVSVFMAGCAGAGKTEAAIELIERFDSGVGTRVMRIDPDDLRQHFVGYTGDNSWIFQLPATILVEKIHDLALKQKQSFLLDGTLSNLDKAVENIERSLHKKRSCTVLYVYQKPELAWQFVVAREKAEGRRIPPEVFVEQFFETRNVANALKEKFGKDLKVDLLVKNTEGTDRSYSANVSKIENHLHDPYDRATLLKVILSGAKV